MVLSHPRKKFVFDSLPPQPVSLCTHGKRVPDFSDRIHGRTTRQRTDDIVSDSPDPRFERFHSIGREERVDRRPKRSVLRLVQGVGHHSMDGYSRGKRGRVVRRSDNIGMPKERDTTGRLGHWACSPHPIIGTALIRQHRF
jgi:hypothetical protein